MHFLSSNYTGQSLAPILVMSHPILVYPPLHDQMLGQVIEERRDGMATEKVSQQFTVITIAFLQKILVGVQNFSPISSDVTLRNHLHLPPPLLPWLP